MSAIEAWQRPEDSERYIKLFYLLLAHKLAITNGLLTDLGLSVLPKLFFENFIDECVLTSVDSAIYW